MGLPNKRPDGFPRRCDLTLLTPIETQLREACVAIELLGCDPKLTDAQNLVQQARDKVSDYLEKD